MQGPSNGVGYSNITGGPAQTKVPSLTPKQLHENWEYNDNNSIYRRTDHGFLPNSVTPNTCLYHNNVSGRAETVLSRVWYDSVTLSFPSLAVWKSGESLVSFLI